MASLHFRKFLLYFIPQTLSESHMQLHESSTVFWYLKRPGKFYYFRMEHRGCNSILLKWDLELFEPVLSFFSVWTRFMLMQSLMADVLNVKFKALKWWDLKNLLLGKSVKWLSQIKLWLSLEYFCCHFTESKL